MLYVIQIDDKYWQILEDGSLKEITYGEYLFLQALNEVVVIEPPPNNSPQTLQPADANQLLSATSLPNSTTSLATFFDTLAREAPFQLPESGFETGESFVTSFIEEPIIGGSSEDVLPPVIPDDASIAVNILDQGDGYINQFEVPAVVTQGSTLGLRDGQIIELLFTDSEGNTLNFTTTVGGDSFTLSGQGFLIPYPR